MRSHAVTILIQHHSHFTAEETSSQQVHAVPKVTDLMVKPRLAPDLKHYLVNQTFILKPISVIDPVEEEGRCGEEGEIPWDP